jgi:hypothetical protein
MIYKHKISGVFLRLLRTKKNSSVFIEVDINNKIIIKRRAWSVRPTEQRRIIKGFEKLVKINLVLL